MSRKLTHLRIVELEIRQRLRNLAFEASLTLEEGLLCVRELEEMFIDSVDDLGDHRKDEGRCRVEDVAVLRVEVEEVTVELDTAGQ